MLFQKVDCFLYIQYIGYWRVFCVQRAKAKVDETRCCASVLFLQDGNRRAMLCAGKGNWGLCDKCPHARYNVPSRVNGEKAIYEKLGMMLSARKPSSVVVRQKNAKSRRARADVLYYVS